MRVEDGFNSDQPDRIRLFFLQTPIFYSMIQYYKFYLRGFGCKVRLNVSGCIYRGEKGTRAPTESLFRIKGAKDIGIMGPIIAGLGGKFYRNNINNYFTHKSPKFLRNYILFCTLCTYINSQTEKL